MTSHLKSIILSERSGTQKTHTMQFHLQGFFWKRQSSGDKSRVVVASSQGLEENFARGDEGAFWVMEIVLYFNCDGMHVTIYIG